MLPLNLSERRLPRLISKQRLRQIFSVDDYNRPCSSHLLKKNVMTKEFVENELGLTMEKYGKIEVFNPAQTSKIYSYFQITIEELE